MLQEALQESQFNTENVPKSRFVTLGAFWLADWRLAAGWLIGWLGGWLASGWLLNMLSIRTSTNKLGQHCRGHYLIDVWGASTGYYVVFP